MWCRLREKTWKKGFYKEKTEKTKKKGKKYGKKKKYFLTPRPCPKEGMLGPTRVELVDLSNKSQAWICWW